jgi:hypothetical protein
MDRYKKCIISRELTVNSFRSMHHYHHTALIQHVQHSKSTVCKTGHSYPPVYSRHPQVQHYYYSTGGGRGDNSSNVPSSTSSYLKTLQSQTTGWWNKAVEATNHVAKDAASKTLDTSQKLAHKAAQQTQQWTQQQANQVVQSASTLSQSATKVVQQQATNLSKATTETLSQASTVAQQSLQQQASNTSQRFRYTTDRLVDTVFGSGTKLLRWLCIWSLAAIFVYGVATTLPIQLIKYSMETKATTTIKDDNDNNNNTNLPTKSILPENATSAIKSIFRWWA